MKMFVTLVTLVTLVMTSSLRLVWFNAVGYDEGVYLLVSRLFSGGSVIYADIPVNKPPLIFIINALLAAFFGYSFLVARLSIVVISLISSFLIYRITRSLAKNSETALLAGVLFFVFSSLPLSETFLILTEPYVMLFELGALFFITKAKPEGSAVNFAFSGVLVGCALLTRQTTILFSVLFFGFLMGGRFFGNISKRRIFPYVLLGASIPILGTVLFFGYFGAIEPMIYQTTAWALEDARPIASLTRLRQTWFSEYLVSSAPLWFLASFILPHLKSVKKHESNSIFIFFIFLWAMAIVAFYTLFGPGFHHEYSETLAPLSILSSLGLYSMGNIIRPCAKLSAMRKIGGLKVCLISASLILLCFNSFNYNVNNGEVFTNDYETIKEVANYLERNIKPTDKLLVFETQHAKIGPLIYFESGRNPVWLKRGFNSLDITDDERDEIIDLLGNDRNTTILLIGRKPPLQFKNGNYIYDYITTCYVIEKEFGLYSPYPGKLENLSITLLRDIRTVSYVVKQKLNLSDTMGASYQIENLTLSLHDEYFPGYTIFNRFDKPVDFSASILSVKIVASAERLDALFIDLVDEKGNFVRYETTLFSSWREVKIQINHLTFTSVGSYADLQKIRQINLVCVAENIVNLSIREISLFEIVHT